MRGELHDTNWCMSVQGWAPRFYYICDAARVWGEPRAMEHTKNASCRGGRAAKQFNYSPTKGMNGPIT